MTAAEQQDALERARQGNAQALGELLHSLRPYVRVLVHSVHRGQVRSRLDDSDLIQDALVEAQRSFARFEGTTVAELLAWLRPLILRTAGHSLRQHLGTGKRNLGLEQSGPGLVENLVDPASSPSSQAVRQEQVALLASRMARLPEDMQTVLLGRHLDDLSIAELAERLGRSEGAVRVLYTRALRRLREECREE